MYIDLEQLRAALAVRDLTDPAHGAHAMQLLCDSIAGALAAAWGASLRVVRASPVVAARDNYDRLYYPADGVARDARYSRWIGPGVLLRTQTSAVIPPALDELARDPSWREVVIVAPGLVEIVTETANDDLPAVARARIGLGPGQKNLLVRVVLRDLDRTLTAAEANVLRDRIYAALHRGTAHQWAARA